MPRGGEGGGIGEILLCPEFPQECFDHKEVINEHVSFLPK